MTPKKHHKPTWNKPYQTEFFSVDQPHFFIINQAERNTKQTNAKYCETKTKKHLEATQTSPKPIPNKSQITHKPTRKKYHKPAEVNP